MTEDHGNIIIALLIFGLFKPLLSVYWYRVRKHLFWRPVGQKVQRWWKARS